MAKPQIIIVDDHQIFRQGLKSIITMENIATVIGEASNGIEFINLLSLLKPDVVLMDLDMPDMNGLEATKRALEIMPDIKIIVFTMFEDEDYFIKMIELGAKGFILKSGDISELEKAIQCVLNGEKYFSNTSYTKKSHTLAKNKSKLIESHSSDWQNKANADMFPPWF